MAPLLPAETKAHASPDFPGFWTVASSAGSYTFPDALVVWTSSSPQSVDGPPRMQELTVFTFDPDAPNRLLEITSPGDTRAAPATTATATWLAEIAAMLKSNTAQQVQLTDLLRVADCSDVGAGERGVVRFQTRLHPTSAEWANYKGGSATWKSMTWPLGRAGSTFGVRQCWCATELQLVPRDLPSQGDEAAAHAHAFFGSAALSTVLKP